MKAQENPDRTAPFKNIIVVENGDIADDVMVFARDNQAVTNNGKGVEIFMVIMNADPRKSVLVMTENMLRRALTS
jgi:hypothetical protein